MISLQELKSEFQLYRNGSTVNRHIPYRLKQMVIESLLHYSKSDVLAATGLGRTSLYNWVKKKNHSPNNSPQDLKLNIDSEFISLDMLATNDLQENINTKRSSLNITITLPNKIKIVISDYDADTLNNLFSSLSGSI